MKDNPGVKLPKLPVVVSHRSEASGTTSIFTTYLAAVSPDWNTKVGKGISVAWPMGIGGKGSEGVTGNIRNTAGALGYVELTYAQQNHLPTAAIRERGGTVRAAHRCGNHLGHRCLSAAQLTQDPRTPIVNPPGQRRRRLSHLRPHLPHHSQRWTG